MSIDWTIDPALGAHEGWVEHDGRRTWYAIVGDEAAERAAGKAPLLLQAEWVLFEQSGHLSHAEEPDRYMAAVADFMARAEAGKVRRRADVDHTGASILAGSRTRSAGSGSLTGRPGSP